MTLLSVVLSSDIMTTRLTDGRIVYLLFVCACARVCICVRACGVQCLTCGFFFEKLTRTFSVLYFLCVNLTLYYFAIKGALKCIFMD